MEAHNPQDVVRFFGGVTKTQAAFNLKSRQTIYYWLKRGRLPEAKARDAMEISKGRLVFSKAAYLDS